MNQLRNVRPLPHFSRLVTFALWGTLFWLGSPLPVRAGDPPSISLQPQSQQVLAGSNPTFSVTAGGTPPLGFQWLKNGTNLTDGGNVAGSTTTNLTLTSVLASDAGAYLVIVSNAAGSLTSTVANLKVADPCIVGQPQSGTIFPAEVGLVGVSVAGTAPIIYQWYKNGVSVAGATRNFYPFAGFNTAADAGDYFATASNVWGVVTSVVAYVDVNLANADGFNPNPNGHVYAIALQADGKVLAGGGFTTLGGQSCSRLVRLNADGTLDLAFHPGADSTVNCLAIQPDGRIIVGGGFATLAGQARSHIGRLNPDGSLDNSFNPGATATVDCLALQPDGKILVGGSFTLLGGKTCASFGRLNADGTIDTNFNASANNTVYCAAVQPDGKIIVGGSFATISGVSRPRLARVKADGTLDTSFNPGPNNSVNCVALQPDGKILTGGSFTRIAGQSRTGLALLNTDGTLDTPFNPNCNPYVVALGVQTDGKILAAGYFSSLGGKGRTYFGRLNADGTLDSSIDPCANGGVESVGIQADGSMLLGGAFSWIGWAARNYFCRLTNSGPATQSLTYDGSTLAWLRGGTGPEAWASTFEYSPDGLSWISLGPGVRIPGGWQLTGIFLPTNTAFRARGYITGGNNNGSSWYVETVSKPPLLISQIQSPATGPFGFNASGPAGQVVIIESSPDLKNWTPVQTNTLGATPITFTDSQSAMQPNAFYRARPGP